MASLSPNDRAPLCLFNYEDGRRCRTPRTANHPHFCFYHAQKEAHAQAAEKISKDLAYFFAGDYLSANDLSTALARLIPAVLRGDIKPRTARTVAFMLQTLSQTIRLAQHEYVTTFGANNWRQAIAEGVAANSKYRHPAQRSDGLQPVTPPSDLVGAQHAAPQVPPRRPLNSSSSQPSTPIPSSTSSSASVEPTLSSAARASTANSNGANTHTAPPNSAPPNHAPTA